MNKQNHVVNRRKNAALRLQKQLETGVKHLRFETVPLTPKDVTRIKQEIANIKAK